MKARLGDQEPEVVGQAFESLLRLEPEHAIAFVGEFLDRASPEIRDEAALALGLARSAAAFELLVENWKRSANPTILRAIGLSRLPEAFDFLIHVIETGGSRDTAAALEALEPHLSAGDLRERVDQAMARKHASPE
jgi:HEAT repeat protein